MDNITGKWKAEWERKKTFFETETGKKKPAKKFLGYFRMGSGVTKAFAVMDAAYANVGKKQNGPNRIKAQNTFEKAIAQAKKTGDAYIKLLDKESAKYDTDDKKIPLKKAITPLLKILKDDIDLCITSATSMLEASRGLNGADGRIDVARAKEMQQYTARLPASLKAAALWIKVQGQNPDVTAFNAGIQKATRDITQNLNNIAILLKKDSHPQGRTAARLVATLTPWANKGRQLDAGKDGPVELRKELKGLRTFIAAIAEWNNAFSRDLRAA